MPAEMINFAEYERDMDYRRFWDKWYIDNGQLPLSTKLAQYQMVEAVQALLDDSNDAFARTRLRYLGEQSLPALLDGLTQPAFLEAPDPDKARSRTYVSPLEKLLALVVPLAPPEAVAPLREALATAPEGSRGPLLRALASLADDDTLETFAAVLSQGDHESRDFVIEGIMTALEEGRGTEAFRTRLAQELEALIRCNAAPPNIHAPDCLFLLDRARASSLLHSNTVLGGESVYMRDALRACTRFDSYPPGEELAALAERVHPYAGEQPDGFVYGRLLLALARIDPERTRKIAQEAIDFGRPEIEANALKALTIVEGVDQPDEVVFARFREKGRESLTRPQCHYLDVYTLIAQAGHSGFYTYFYSTAGNDARRHLTALREVGAKECASLLKRAMDMLGWFGPATDQEERRAQLEQLPDSQAANLVDLDARFNAIAAEVERCLRHYVLKHKQDFQRQA